MEEIRTHSNHRNNCKVVVESKKHWVAYILPVILLLIFGVPFLIGVLAGFYDPKNFIMLMIPLPVVFLSIFAIINNQSISWTLTEEELIIKSGFLPWKKMYYLIPVEDIYEAYYSTGFLATIFGFGDLSIRRTEGSTTGFTFRTMNKHKEISGEINSRVRGYKKLKYNQPSVSLLTKGNSVIDELSQMAALKKEGLLTPEEFQQMKSVLLNSRR